MEGIATFQYEVSENKDAVFSHPSLLAPKRPGGSLFETLSLGWVRGKECLGRWHCVLSPAEEDKAIKGQKRNVRGR